jgi:hypothetical protein
VKQLYKDLEIEGKFHAYEAESYKRITAHVSEWVGERATNASLRT